VSLKLQQTIKARELAIEKGIPDWALSHGDFCLDKAIGLVDNNEDYVVFLGRTISMSAFYFIKAQWVYESYTQSKFVNHPTGFRHLKRYLNTGEVVNVFDIKK